MGRIKIVFILIAFLSGKIFSQKCNFVLEGIVTESATDKPLSDVSVFITELSKGVVTNQQGFFRIEGICKGDYHVEINHIGCEAKQLFFKIDKNTEVNVSINHFVEMLDGVHLLGHKTEKTTQSVQKIGNKDIQQNANKNLGTLLESLTGVSTIKNGSGIAKPVVHGMYGNRLMVLNNGIVQSGQQWGNDHSPEIDPLVANSIHVIKGVSALEHQGNSLGSLILVKPKEINKDPHLHGASNSFFESNGNGVGTNLSLEKSSDLIDWKVSGTLKKYGDRNTPNYYLNNTGSTEANLALQLRKQWNEKLLTKVYASTFNTELGVLMGSHVSTQTDLEYALIRDEPFNTEENFSYNLEAPKQEVHHHLLKLYNKYSVDENTFYEFTYAGQLDLRKEFDRRRNGLSEVPAMNLIQSTHYLEVKHQNKINDKTEFNKGLQYTFTDNTNDSETGVLPLIPDYLSHQIGGFSTLTHHKNNWMYELGARYNYTFQNVATIDKSTSEIVKYNNNFNSLSLATGVSYRTEQNFHWSWNAGWTSRNPAINELYSNGLHQGVAAIEIGDPNLEQENAIKTTLGFEGDVAQKWFFESLLYYQYINDYIFLKPVVGYNSDTRGVFWVFEYNQTNAEIMGLDLATSYQLTEKIKAGVKYSFLRGNNLSEDIPLVGMSPNNLLLNVDYNLEELGLLKNTFVGVNYRYTWKQNHLNNDQDVVNPPEAYQLVGLKLGTETKINKTKLSLYANVTNLFDVTYRDYLNRLRYFSNENGRSFMVGIQVNF